MRMICVRMIGAVCVAAQVFLWSPSSGHAIEQPQQDVASDFTLQDVDQARVYTLSSYREKQPVLLFFWTTWCPFCQKALKSLSMMHDELKSRGVEVLAVNLGEDGAKVRHAVAYYKLPFPVLIDERSSTIDAYNLLGVPTYILIDKQGGIVFKDNYLPRNKIFELLEDG